MDAIFLLMEHDKSTNKETAIMAYEHWAAAMNAADKRNQEVEESYTKDVKSLYYSVDLVNFSRRWN